MKRLLFLFSSFVFLQHAMAQCPYISGALIDAVNAGTPTGEGKNEFVAFNTGTSAVNINSIFISYGTTTTSTVFSINGAAAPSVWTSPTTAGLFTNSAGTITNVSSGTIPANRNVIVISKDNVTNYDFQTFGSDVYVLSYDQTLAGVSAFNPTGNFANSGAALRYLRISQGASCRDTVSYIPNSLPGADGGGAKWNASGVITYLNTGSSGAVLPINLLRFEAQVQNKQSIIQWTTTGNSNAVYFEVEKSRDGVNFEKIATVFAEEAKKIAEKKYQFVDVSLNAQLQYYRLRIVDIEGSVHYAPTIKLINQEHFYKDFSHIYPNPFTNDLVFLNNETDQYSDLLILDLLGKSCHTQVLHDGENKIDASGLVAGIYFVQLKNKQRMECFKIVKN